MATIDYTGNTGVAAQLYLAYLGRPADSISLNWWAQNLPANGSVNAATTAAFFNSTEGQALFGNMTTSQVINQAFQNLFGRAATTDDLKLWGQYAQEQGFTNADLPWQIFKAGQSSTADQANLNTRLAAAAVYTSSADANAAQVLGLQTVAGATLAREWLAPVTSSSDLNALNSSVPASLAAVGNNATPSQTIPLTTGLDNLTGTAGNDTFNADQTQLQASDIINGGSGTDTLNYTDAGTTGGNVPAAQVSNVEIINVRNVNGTAAVAATKESATVTFGAVTANQTVIIGGVTFTDGGAGSTAAQVAAYFAANVPGGYVVTATSGSQITFTATTTGNQNNLQVTGTGAGTQSIVVVDGAAAVPSTGVTDTINAGNFAGATDFNSNLSLNDVTVNGLAAGQKAGLVGNGTLANGNLTANYAAAATAATVNVAGGTTQGTVTVNGAGLTSATINSTGAANTLAGITLANTVTSATINAATNLTTGGITDTGLTTLTVTGAATKVDVGTLGAAVKTVDASGLTAGGLTATLNTTITSFKGGAGNDIITAAATTATGASIDAGAGTGDVLVVDSTSGATNDIATNGAAYKNFEVLKNTSATTATQLDVSKVAGITAVETAAAGGGFSKLTAAQAASIKVSANLANTATAYALADASGTADVLGLNFVGATATTVENARALNVGDNTGVGFETLNLTAGSGGSNVMLKADGVTAAVAGTDFDSFAIATATTALKTVTLAGAYAAQVDLSTNATKVTTLDASANTAGAVLKTGGQVGALTVTGTAAADSIILGTMNGGTQTINAGAGNDTITGAYADIVAATAIDGGAGTDTLKFSDTTSAVSVADVAFKNISNVEKFSFGSTTGALTWTVGGYANALATANGGVLDVAAKAVTTGAVTIDASGLGGTNSLKLAITEASAASTSVGAITVTGSVGGADSITIVSTSTSTGTPAAITIDESHNTAGSKIDLSGVAGGGSGTAGAISVTGGTGADTILGGALAATITGGAGNDTITLLNATHGAQTLQFAADSGTDTVSNFNTTSDILKGAVTSSALLSTTDMGNGWTVSTNGMASKAGATAADFVAAANAVTLQGGASAAKGVVAFDDGHNTWVVYTDGTSNTTHDSVIELVGVTGITALNGTGGATALHLA